MSVVGVDPVVGVGLRHDAADVEYRRPATRVDPPAHERGSRGQVVPGARQRQLRVVVHLDDELVAPVEWLLRCNSEAGARHAEARDQWRRRVGIRSERARAKRVQRDTPPKLGEVHVAPRQCDVATPCGRRRRACPREQPGRRASTRTPGPLPGSCRISWPEREKPPMRGFSVAGLLAGFFVTRTCRRA